MRNMSINFGIYGWRIGFGSRESNHCETWQCFSDKVKILDKSNDLH